MAELAGAAAALVVNTLDVAAAESGLTRMAADASQLGIPLIMVAKSAGSFLQDAVRRNPALRLSVQTHSWVAEGANMPLVAMRQFSCASCSKAALLSLAGVDDPTCWCTTNGTSGGAAVPYSRCGDHFHEGVLPWCFVTGGMQCKAATPSHLSPGAAWRECVSSQCGCTTDGMSGSVNVTPKVGCQERSQHGLAGFCYVAGGEKCATIVAKAAPNSLDATASLAFADPPVGEPGAAYRICAPEACQCTKTGLSGGVPVEAIGCADHFKEKTLPWYAAPLKAAPCSSHLRRLGVVRGRTGVNSKATVPGATSREGRGVRRPQRRQSMPERRRRSATFARAPRRGSRTALGDRPSAAGTTTKTAISFATQR